MYVLALVLFFLHCAQPRRLLVWKRLCDMADRAPGRRPSGSDSDSGITFAEQDPKIHG
jgi:hypothetical protein